jgi:hypothetical protein
VQKILQNSTLNWSSLMLSKVDEAAYPWALIKGLSEQSLGVSCMAGSTRMEQAAQPFEAARLVQLALTPLQQHMPVALDVMPKVPVLAASPEVPVVPVRVPRTKKPAAAVAIKTLREPVDMACINDVDDNILIPTLMGSVPMKPSRRKSANASSALKVAHG